MKFLFSIFLAALFAAFALAATKDQRPVVVSYPKGTPDHVIEEAMEAVRTAGGTITHEYHLIKGFAARITDETLEVIHKLGGGKHKPIVEDDKVVTISNND